MGAYAFQHRNVSDRRACVAVLAGLWIIGFLYGVHSVHTEGEAFVCAMHSAAACRMSIIFPFGALVLPFVYTAFSLYISRPMLIYPLCVLKAVLYGAASYALVFAFGRASWLVSAFLLFSDHLSIFILWLIWIPALTGRNSFSWRKSLIEVSFVIAAGILDYLFISPYLVFLISNTGR